MEQHSKEITMANETISDHDILITLVETVKNNQVTVVEKISDVKDKVQEVNDGISAKVNDHEMRIKRIEYTLDTTSPIENTKRLANLVTWQKQVEFKIKFVFALIFIAGGIFEWVVSEAIRIFLHIP